MLNAALGCGGNARLVQVQLTAGFTFLGPTNGSLQPAKTEDPHFDALAFNQAASGFDTEPSIRKVQKGAMHDGTVEAGDRARLTGWNTLGAGRISWHGVALMVRCPT
jgi:hypothetical protein